MVVSAVFVIFTNRRRRNVEHNMLTFRNWCLSNQIILPLSASKELLSLCEKIILFVTTYYKGFNQAIATNQCCHKKGSNDWNQGDKWLYIYTILRSRIMIKRIQYIFIVNNQKGKTTAKCTSLWNTPEIFDILVRINNWHCSSVETQCCLNVALLL